MEINEALKIFEIDEKADITSLDAKKEYRRLAKKYHPDNQNGDTKKFRKLKVALGVIEALQKAGISTATHSIAWFKLEELLTRNQTVLDIYGNKHNYREAVSGESNVMIDTKVTLNGNEYFYTATSQYMMTGKYDLVIEAPLNVDEELKEVKIEALGESRSMTISNRYTSAAAFKIITDLVILNITVKVNRVTCKPDVEYNICKEDSDGKLFT